MSTSLVDHIYYILHISIYYGYYNFYNNGMEPSGELFSEYEIYYMYVYIILTIVSLSHLDHVKINFHNAYNNGDVELITIFCSNVVNAHFMPH